MHAGAEVADNVLVPQATEDLHFHLDFIVLLERERKRKLLEQVFLQAKINMITIQSHDMVT